MCGQTNEKENWQVKTATSFNIKMFGVNRSHQCGQENYLQGLLLDGLLINLSFLNNTNR